MASEDIEIEIKLFLDAASFHRARENVKKIAQFIKKTSQADEYFIPSHRNFLGPTFPFEWLSLRKRGNKSILNYKHFYPEDAEVKTHCDEFETAIEAPEKLEKKFSSL